MVASAGPAVNRRMKAALMLYGRSLIGDAADVRFVNALIVRSGALARHPRAALTAKLFTPGEV
jgi:hypothetical protein